jgi:hypothetical protein
MGSGCVSGERVLKESSEVAVEPEVRPGERIYEELV